MFTQPQKLNQEPALLDTFTGGALNPQAPSSLTRWWNLAIAAILTLFTAGTFFAIVWLQWLQYQWLDRILYQKELTLNTNEQWQLLHQQGQWSLILVVAETLGLVVFMFMMFRQNHHLAERNRQLREITADLENARNAAVDANRAKGEFLANMSHEIRTPFQGLLGMLNLLEGKLENQQQQEYLRNAFESAEHLLELINDVLDISTIEAGNLRLTIRPMHLQSVLSEVENLMRLPAEQKGLELSISLENDPEHPMPEWLMADPRRMRQIMFNLLSNAIKFTSQGKIEARFKRLHGSDDLYLFTVQDTGLGMDEETLGNLFTRFYQADTSVRRRVGGSGLGLEISRNLARMMGGDITATSAVGAGSLFIVMLQLPPADAESVSATDEVQLNEVSHQRSLRILIAEDHPLNLKFLSLLLERMGHQATLCGNGELAYKHAQKQAFDVILLDYHMPIMDGLATSRAIRNLHRTSPNSKTSAEGVKIILITADGLNETRQKASLAGVDVVMVKPVLEQDLQRAFVRCGLFEVLEEHRIVKTVSKPHALEGEEEGAPIAELAPPVKSSSPSPTIRTLPLIDEAHWRSIESSLSQKELSDLLETLFGEDGTMKKLLQQLEWLVSVEGETVNPDEIQALGQTAHQLKGASLMLGFRQLAELSHGLENLAKKAPAELSAAWLDNISTCAQSTQVAANQLLYRM